MFDIGWSEMAVILLVALIVIGPKDLPRVARTMGRWAGKGRAMAREFQTALEDMAREAELDKVKSEIEKAGRTIEKAGRTDLAKSIEKTVDPSGELSKAFDPTAGSAKSAGGKPNSAPAAASPAKGSDVAAPAKALPDQPRPEGAAPEPAPANSSSAKTRAAKTPAAKTSAAQNPAAQKPAAQKPAAQKLAAQKPAAQTSSAETSAAKPGPANALGDRGRPEAAAPSERTEPARETAPAEPS
jgi:sec-independent protein translocase protein TatB